MSVFLCSDLHTAVVAQLLKRENFTMSALKMMTELRKLNNAALAYRYGDKPVRLANRAEALSAADRWLAGATVADKCKVVTCFVYQCDEGDTLKCPLGKALQALEATLVNRAEARGYTHSPFWDI